MSRHRRRRKQPVFIPKNTQICRNCGQCYAETGGHFVPPSLGHKGFWICDNKEINL